jgi:hypothetical protein
MGCLKSCPSLPNPITVNLRVGFNIFRFPLLLKEGKLLKTNGYLNSEEMHGRQV